MVYIHNIFEGKKVTIMGLGLLGGALNDVIFLARHGVELIVTDLKSEEELAPSLEKLVEFKNIKYTLGKHNLEDFQTADFILQPGNVPLDSVFLAEARKNNIPIYVSESLFAKYSQATLVGVTGTRGKSTTTHMIYEVLKQYPPQGTHIFLAGNVKNVSTLALLEHAQEEDIVVLELDSWSLHGMGDIKKSPHVAVFTTFFDDHLNFYKNNKDLYLEDKAQIFKYQTKGDFLIVGDQVKEIIKDAYSKEIKSKIIVSNIKNNISLKIPGEHNLYNASCAYEALKVLGINEENIKAGLEEFKGLGGRLEFIKEVRGVKIYNDTTATTPEATIAALKALNKNIVLIMGGSDKGLDMTKLIEEIPKHCKEVILLQGSGTDLLKAESKQPKAVSVKSLTEAVEKALKLSNAGDVILFSPAFASFGMFKNEFDRGDKFNEIIENLK